MNSDLYFTARKTDTALYHVGHWRKFNLHLQQSLSWTNTSEKWNSVWCVVTIVPHFVQCSSFHKVVRRDPTCSFKTLHNKKIRKYHPLTSLSPVPFLHQPICSHCLVKDPTEDGTVYCTLMYIMGKALLNFILGDDSQYDSSIVYKQNLLVKYMPRASFTFTTNVKEVKELCYYRVVPC